METELDFSQISLGFIGAGTMAGAIIEQLIASKLVTSSQIRVSYPSAVRALRYAHLHLAAETDDNCAVVRACDVLVLCVKPQMLAKVCEQIGNLIEPARHLIVSIAAGITIDNIVKMLQAGGASMEVPLRMCRLSVNTAALIGQSCSVYTQNGQLTNEDKQFVVAMLSNIGRCLGEIKDCDFDAAAACSGSSIAYMYMMVDAMADAGVKMGLQRQLALGLAMQTMQGAAGMMLQNRNKHPIQLKDEVCSPGGTTIQGVHELERNGFRNSIMCAIEAVVKRAKQL